MSKRTTSVGLDHVAKRQRSNADLPNKGNAGQVSNEGTRNVRESSSRLSTGGGNGRGSEPEISDALHFDSETRHVTTPSASYCPSPKGGSFQTFGPGDIDSLGERPVGMKVRDRNHSVSQYTIYRPGLENTEERYDRTFVEPLYGSDDHRYHLPVDEEEAERAEMGHTCWLSTTLLLYVRTEPGVHLDLGAGYGAWVQEVAQMKPNCKVVGIDLYYDELPDAPKQAEFEVDDCELSFAEREESVALVNIRDSFLWVRDLKALLSRVRDILRPNGCFQCQEIRLSDWNSNKPKICHWRDEVLASASELGIQLHSASDVQRALVENDFTEYGEERLAWAIENVPRLHEYVKLTVRASVGILQDARGQSATADRIIDGALEELEANDCWIEIGVDVCWAKKFVAAC